MGLDPQILMTARQPEDNAQPQAPSLTQVPIDLGEFCLAKNVSPHPLLALASDLPASYNAARSLAACSAAGNAQRSPNAELINRPL